MTDSVGDCEAWGLTPPQQAHYFGRLNRYHADRALRHAAAVIRLAWLTTALWVASTLALVAVLVLTAAT